MTVTKEMIEAGCKAAWEVDGLCWPDDFNEGERRDSREAMEAALTAALSAQPAPAVPDGWKLVPVEPTEAMKDDGRVAQSLASGLGEDWQTQVGDIYRAMLSAAPQPAPQPVDAEDEAYEIGRRDGYSEAVQQIDQLTGGDGEYRYCTDHDPDRHTPGPAEMIQRIVDRFETLNLLRDTEKDGRDQDWGLTTPPADLREENELGREFADQHKALIKENGLLREENERLKAERLIADHKLVDRYRNPKNGKFSFPDDVAAIVRALDAAEARVKALEEALQPFAEVAPIFDHAINPSPNRDEHVVYEWQSLKVNNGLPVSVYVGDFRRARATLKGGEAND